MSKFEPLTLVRVCVEPHGPGGCNGPPIEVGVVQIMRTREHRASIALTFDPPRADLLGVDFDDWSDEEIEGLAGTLFSRRAARLIDAGLRKVI